MSDARLAALVGAWLTRTGRALPPVWDDLFPSLPDPLPDQSPDLDRLVESLAGERGARRRRGVYHTPEWLVDEVLASVRTPPLLDPACGAGAFLVGAVRAGVPVGQLYGCDCDPIAVLAARLRLAELGADPAVVRAQLRCTDTLLDHDWDGRFAAVVGNPPWGVALTPAQRAALAPEPGQPCSATLFLRAAARLLQPGGRLGFVLPESWLSTRRAEGLRRWLLEELRLERLDLLTKRIFTAAPDMVPTILIASRERPDDRPTTVRCYGLRRAAPREAPTAWQRVHEVAAKAWREEPLAVFALHGDPRLSALWHRMAASCVRLDTLVDLHDGVYKSRLVPLLGSTGRPTLVAAKLVRREGIVRDGLPRVELDRLPAAEAARMAAPKLLVHALRKPALPDRIVAACDELGEFVASNNFLLLLRKPECPWSLSQLAAWLNSRLVNCWYAERFLQVNIEAFTLGAVPLPPSPAGPLPVTSEEAEALRERWLARPTDG